MELINIEQLMRDKLDECNAWLGGKDEAVPVLTRLKKHMKAQDWRMNKPRMTLQTIMTRTLQRWKNIRATSNIDSESWLSNPKS